MSVVGERLDDVRPRVNELTVQLRDRDLEDRLADRTDKHLKPYASPAADSKRCSASHGPPVASVVSKSSALDEDRFPDDAQSEDRRDARR